MKGEDDSSEQAVLNQNVRTAADDVKRFLLLPSPVPDGLELLDRFGRGEIFGFTADAPPIEFTQGFLFFDFFGPNHEIFVLGSSSEGKRILLAAAGVLEPVA